MGEEGREEEWDAMWEGTVQSSMLVLMLRNSVELFAERVENRASCAMAPWQ